jgi:hypothetical protein
VSAIRDAVQINERSKVRLNNISSIVLPTVAVLVKINLQLQQVGEMYGC